MDIKIRTNESEILGCISEKIADISRRGYRICDDESICKIITNLSLIISKNTPDLYHIIEDIVTDSTNPHARIHACKKYREITGGLLREAVDYVDAVAARKGILWGKYNTEGEQNA